MNYIEYWLRVFYQRYKHMDHDMKKRRLLSDLALNSKCINFVETGTYLGDTLHYMKGIFILSISIELDHDLARHNQRRFYNCRDVAVWEGNSKELIKDAVNLCDGNTFYWLDAHFSGGFTAKGKKNTPILDELHSILKDNPNDNIICIDDARCFDGTNDYPTTTYLRNFVKLFDRRYKVKIKDDIIIIRK